MHEHTLNALRQHYNMLPIGLPEVPSRLERAFLNVLFTEEEAHAALHMTPQGQAPQEVARKLGRSEKEVLELLETMVRKGLILRREKDGEKVYSIELFVPGVYEFQVGIYNEVVARLFEVFLPEYAPELFGTKPPWAWVIPAERSLPVSTEVAPYERASEIVKGTKKVALAECICRKERKLIGRVCDRPKDEICLIFSPWAELYVERGIAKAATVDEALKAIDQAEQAGLVRLATNVRQNHLFMCQCCSCCCGIMRGMVEFGQSTAIQHSNYVPVINKESCNGCPDCVKACTMHALSLVQGKAKMDGTKCIGCGLCATACSSGAILMRRKAESKVKEPPVDWDELMTIIAHERGRRHFYK
ncbi:MAG: 4Fe-4S dicluster domain-containing protein [Chloroflexota bacterium]